MTVDYANDHSPIPRRGKSSSIAFGIATTIAILVTFTALRIEYLNVKAGRPLPEKSFNGTWRYLPWANEAKWRQTFGPKDAEGMPVTRPLTPAESAKMHKGMARAAVRNRLLMTVSSLGFLNFLLVPILACVSLCLLISATRKWERYAALGLFGDAIGAGVLMVYRGYSSCL